MPFVVVSLQISALLILEDMLFSLTSARWIVVEILMGKGTNVSWFRKDELLYEIVEDLSYLSWNLWEWGKMYYHLWHHIFPLLLDECRDKISKTHAILQ